MGDPIGGVTLGVRIKMVNMRIKMRKSRMRMTNDEY